MMRIQVHRSETECTLRVEGEIAGIASGELESFWRDLDCPESVAVTVDVSAVIHIDRKARRLLRSMHESGIRFIGGRLAIQDILDEIKASGRSVDNTD